MSFCAPLISVLRTYTLVALVWLFTPALMAQELVISEFLASNQGGLRDEDGDSADWVELFNPGANAVDLAGWALTDDRAALRKWVFPARQIGPRQHLLVFASGKDRAPDTGELHTNFQLQSGGEYLGLVSPTATVVHEYAPEFRPQRENISYGLAARDLSLLPSDAAVTWHVPSDGTLDAVWMLPEFDDSAWFEGALPVGFESETPNAANFYAAVIADEPELAAYWRCGDSDTVVRDELRRRQGEYVGDFSLGAPGAIIGDDDTAVDFVVGSVVFPPEPPLRLTEASFSIEAWVQPDLSGPFQWIASRDDSLSLVDYMVGFSPSGRVRFVTQGGRNTLNTEALTLDGEQWYHIVAVQDAAARTKTIYVNGEVAGQRELGVGLPPTSLENGLRLGARSDRGGRQHLDGRLDEVALYRRALTETEVRRHFDLASTPRGFEPLIATNLRAAMRNQNSSVYLRIPFDLNTQHSLDTLELQVRYDDGFIAYLNGVEVAKRNADLAVWNAAANTDRPKRASLRAEVIDLLGARELLRPGGNVVAIHGFNDAVDGSDFIVSARLDARTVPVPGYFPEVTPGRTNSANFVDFVGDTRFSRDRGFYDETFEVVISTSTPEAVIRYTTNGSPPMADTGQVYDGPILIDRTTILRAAAFKGGYIPTNVDTHTYIFLDDVLVQDGSAAPATWGPTPADYAMDATVVNDPRYSGQFRDALTALPTLSIVMPQADLFGADGIYSNPTRTGIVWERAASVEYFGDGAAGSFQVDAGARMHGGSSRRPDITPQHSLRLHFRGEYGTPRLNFPLFPDSDVESFDTLVVSASSSDNWTSANTATGAVAQFIRDQWARDVQRQMGHEWVPGRFVHLYLNGLYWGLYNLVERVDDGFASTHFGGEKLEYDVIVDGETRSGNSIAWRELLSSARAADFDAVSRLLDVDNFIDYMLINMFTGNWDWPDHNWAAIRRRVPDGRFRFPVWDAEVGLGLDVNVPGPIVANVLDVDLTGERADVASSDVANGPGEIYNRLRGDPEFRLWFADRLQEHLVGDGALAAEQATALYEVRAGEIETALLGESARWGDVRRTPPDVPDGRWLTERRWIVDTFFPARPSIVLEQFRRHDLFPAVAAPLFNHPGGVVDAGFAWRASTASGGDGRIFYTLDGADPRRIGGGVSGAALAFDVSGEQPLRRTTRIKARTLQSGVWSAANSATYYVSTPALRISELMYHPLERIDESEFDSDEFEFIELLNIGPQPINLTGVRFTAGIDFVFPEEPHPDADLAPGEVVLVVRNFEAFASRYDTTGLYVAGEFTGNLANNGERVALHDATDRIVFEFTYDDAWFPATDGGGRSLVPDEVSGDSVMLRERSGWRAGAETGGSPGVVEGESILDGFQLPGDVNQSGTLDHSDAISLLRYLFAENGGALPCLGGSMASRANVALADVDGSARVNVTDAIYVLRHLFVGGPPPALGTECVPLAGCPSICAGAQ